MIQMFVVQDPNLRRATRLLIYEKCGAVLAPELLAAQLPQEHFMAVWQVDRADIGWVGVVVLCDCCNYIIVVIFILSSFFPTNMIIIAVLYTNTVIELCFLLLL